MRAPAGAISVRGEPFILYIPPPSLRSARRTPKPSCTARDARAAAGRASGRGGGWLVLRHRDRRGGGPIAGRLGAVPPPGRRCGAAVMRARHGRAVTVTGHTRWPSKDEKGPSQFPPRL